jgi:hypothetical protein
MDEIKKNKDYILWFELGAWVTEHAVMFVCTQIELLIVWWYSYPYDVIL